MYSVLFLLFTSGCSLVLGNNVRISNRGRNFADVSVHAGFKKIGIRFPQKILDIWTFQSDDLNGWYQINLLTDNVNNSLVLHKFDGRNLETILRSSEPIDVENCRKIYFFKSLNLRFIIVYDCALGADPMHIYLFEDEVQMTFKKLPTVGVAKVYDVAMWDNPTVRSTYLMVIGQKKLSDIERAYYFRYDQFEGNFTSFGYVKMSKPTSISLFTINSERYVAVASQRDVHGDLSESQLFIQSDTDGHLIKFQKLYTKGIVAITYFNFTSGQENEHFLIAAVDHDINIKDSSVKDPQDVYYEESVIYKFDDGFFIPFQTLSIPAPTKFLLLGDLPMLISWSLTGGLVSYQYNGWRFTDTESDHQLLGHVTLPGELRKVSTLQGEMFTFVSSKGESQKYFFRPTFNTSSLAFETYYSDLKWCENTGKEIRLVKKRLNNYYPYGEECKTNSKVYTDEEKIYALIYQAFKYVHDVTENEITNEEVTICCGRESANVKQIEFNNTESIVTESEDEPSQSHICEVRKEFVLEGVSHVAALSAGLLFQNSTEFVLYPTLGKFKTYETYNKVKVGNLKQKNLLVTAFSKVDLCSSDGIFLEGVYKGKMFGAVYRLKDAQEISLVQTLILPGRSTVKGLCMENKLNCFMVGSKTKGICSLQCPNLYRPIYCNSPSSFDVLKSSYYNLISVNPRNEIVVSRLNNKTFLNLGMLTSKAASPKIITSANIQGTDYVLIQNGSKLELCWFSQKDMNDQFTSKCENFISRIQKPHYLQLAEVNNSVGIYLGDLKNIDLYIKSDNGFIVNRVIDYEYNHFTSFNLGDKHFIAVLENVDYVLYSLKC